LRKPTSIITCLHEGQNSNADRWLDIAVRAHGATGAYTELSPRQQILPTPTAVYSTTAGTATSANMAASAATAASATTASNFSTGLLGDVTGTQNATVVSKVGGQLAANVAQGVSTAYGATSSNTSVSYEQIQSCPQRQLNTARPESWSWTAFVQLPALCS